MQTIFEDVEAGSLSCLLLHIITLLEEVFLTAPSAPNFAREVVNVILYKMRAKRTLYTFAGLISLDWIGFGLVLTGGLSLLCYFFDHLVTVGAGQLGCRLCRERDEVTAGGTNQRRRRAVADRAAGRDRDTLRLSRIDRQTDRQTDATPGQLHLCVHGGSVSYVPRLLRVYRVPVDCSSSGP